MLPAAVPHQSRALGMRASGVAGLLGPCPLEMDLAVPGMAAAATPSQLGHDPV